MKTMTRLFATASIAALALVAAACGGGESTPEAAPAPAPKAAAPEAPPAAAPAAAPVADAAAPAGDAAAAAPAAAAAVPDEAALKAILVTADAADGAVDMTVSKCAGCKLGMQGKAEHSIMAHGYTLHFCSAECKATAEGGADAVIAALK